MKRRAIDWKALLFFVIYTYVIGAGLGTLLGGTLNFDDLQKPSFTPPAWVFPVAWAILYGLMAVAAYLVYVSGDIDRGSPLRLYLLQVIVNSLWPLFFFRLEWRLLAFFWLLLLLGLVIFTAIGFRPISKVAFWLMIPYILWLLFAAYLNFSFYVLNG